MLSALRTIHPSRSSPRHLLTLACLPSISTQAWYDRRSASAGVIGLPVAQSLGLDARRFFDARPRIAPDLDLHPHLRPRPRPRPRLVDHRPRCPAPVLAPTARMLLNGSLPLRRSTSYTFTIRFIV
jgi:hypothetical protein